MASVEEIDSGMESLTASSKDLTPEKMKQVDDDDIDDEDLDETLTERLLGLTEMFPEKVRDCTYTIFSNIWTGIRCVYSVSRVASWAFFSSSVILFAPVIIELERAQMEEMQRQQQRQILLGPNAAMQGGIAPGMGLVPQVQR